MVGAIHSLSQARDAAWTETLIALCARMSVWLDELNYSAEASSRRNLNLQTLSSSDTVMGSIEHPIDQPSCEINSRPIEAGQGNGKPIRQRKLLGYPKLTSMNCTSQRLCAIRSTVVLVCCK